MDRQKKSLIKREFKERPPQRGVFRVHSSATGQNWIDASPTLHMIKNRVWFDLRMGSHRNLELQQAWDEGGPDAMVFEVVEVFPEDASTYAVERLMEERRAYWMERFGATPCLSRRCNPPLQADPGRERLCFARQLALTLLVPTIPPVAPGG